MAEDQDTALPCDLVVVRSLALRALRADDRAFEVVASTADLDAHGEIVEQSWQLDRYRRNPVVLYAHDSRALPIGKATGIDVRDGELVATVVLASKAANPLADQVLQSLCEGTLRGVSVGFRPHEIRQESRDGRPVTVLADNELLELSITPIPSNPHAVVRLRSLAEAIGEDEARGAVAYYAAPPVPVGRWDAGAAEKRLRAWASKGATVDWARYARGFAWVDPAKADNIGGYKLPHHDVRNGELVTVRAGVIAAGNAMAGSRGGVRIPAIDRGEVQAHLAKHYRQFSLTAPWDKALGDDKMDERNFEAVETQRAELVAALDVATRALTERDATVAAEQGRTKALEAQAATLEAARAEQQKRADAAEAEVARRDLDGLVGKKLTAAERDGLLAVFVLDRAVYAKQLDAIQARPDMQLTAPASVVGADPAPAKTAPMGGDNGAGFDRLVRARMAGAL